jgi:hypothetical protein
VDICGHLFAARGFAQARRAGFPVPTRDCHEPFQMIRLMQLWAVLPWRGDDYDIARALRRMAKQFGVNPVAI